MMSKGTDVECGSTVVIRQETVVMLLNLITVLPCSTGPRKPVGLGR